MLRNQGGWRGTQIVTRDVRRRLRSEIDVIRNDSSESKSTACFKVNPFCPMCKFVTPEIQCTVMELDWTGVDSSPNPLHPASKLFDSRSSTELHYIYILYLEKLGISIVL